ncbi:MAG: FmdB family transcriptional regulator [Planctomycetaceae bacterium]|nr:FmdB family transcriptional regulator [Planctomycetaceae bacterium]
MPIYVYEVVEIDGSSGETFEWLQGMHEPPLTQHPDTGVPVRRVITAANMAGTWSDMKASSNLSNKNLAEKGFTKYVKAGDGKYEKAAGNGPNVISAD